MSIVHVSPYWTKAHRWVEVGGWAIATYDSWKDEEICLWDLHSSRKIATLPLTRHPSSSSKLVGAKGRNRLVYLDREGIHLYDFDSSDKWTSSFLPTPLDIRFSLLKDAEFWGEDENHLFVMTRRGWHLVNLDDRSVVRSLHHLRLYAVLGLTAEERREMNRPFGWTTIEKSKDLMILHFRHAVMKDLFILWNLKEDKCSLLGTIENNFYHRGEIVLSVAAMEDGRLLSWSTSSIVLWNHREKWTNERRDLLGVLNGNVSCVHAHGTKVVAGSYQGMIQVLEARKDGLARLYAFDLRQGGIVSCFRQGTDPLFWFGSENQASGWATLNLESLKLSLPKKDEKPSKPLQPFGRQLCRLPYNPFLCWSEGGVFIEIGDGFARFAPPKPPSRPFKDLHEELVDYFYAPPYGPAYLDLKEANKDLFA